MDISKITVSVPKKSIVVNNPTKLVVQQMLLSGGSSTYIQSADSKTAFIDAAKALGQLTVKKVVRKKTFHI